MHRRGSKRNLRRIRARDYWSWRTCLIVAAFVCALVWLIMELAGKQLHHQ